MAETAGQPSRLDTPKAAKDRNCPYCQQAFTSSSLGRHLDLYIKDKNPKPPDGIHNVDEIRKIRGGVTRRQARGTPRRARIASTATPAGASQGSRASEDGDSLTVRSPASQRTPAPPTGQADWEAWGSSNDFLREINTQLGGGRAGATDGGEGAGQGTGNTLRPLRPAGGDPATEGSRAG